VAVDAAGNLFIADASNHRVRRVDAASGIITTVAGGVSLVFPDIGDGGPATSARLRLLSGVAVDAVGNLFIADRNHQRIRRVDASTGIITTVAGTGFRGFSGDGFPATSASLGDPSGVAVDAFGNLFIADERNHRIRRVDAASGIITTVAGNGIRGFSGDGGLATSASLRNPFDVALDAAGNLFIADASNHRIRRVDAASGIITTVAGGGFSVFPDIGDGGPATSASLAFPTGVAVDAAGNLFIADNSNQRIRRVAPSGVITTVAGDGSFGFSGDGGPATQASLAGPRGVAVDSAGSLFIADERNHRIRRVGISQTPAEAIQDLVELVAAINLKQGIANSLDSKLDAAFQAVDDLNQNNDVAAINSLQAFINSVEAQRGVSLTDTDADILIAAARQIIALLGG
jgi:hypothetical protein